MSRGEQISTPLSLEEYDLNETNKILKGLDQVDAVLLFPWLGCPQTVVTVSKYLDSHSGQRQEGIFTRG